MTYTLSQKFFIAGGALFGGLTIAFVNDPSIRDNSELNRNPQIIATHQETARALTAFVQRIENGETTLTIPPILADSFEKCGGFDRPDINDKIKTINLHGDGSIERSYASSSTKEKLLTCFTAQATILGRTPEDIRALDSWTRHIFPDLAGFLVGIGVGGMGAICLLRGGANLRALKNG